MTLTELAREALAIEEHYGRPMDIEWGKDGLDGRLYILQARPETVKSRQSPPVSSVTGSMSAALSSQKAAPLARDRCRHCTRAALGRRDASLQPQ